jgi:predicted O-methyltransferase YrrM
MVRQVQAIVGYLKHAARAKSPFRLHSPFVYHFYSEVLCNGRHHVQYRVVDRVRREMLTASRFIKRKDMGARAPQFPSDQRFVRVRDLMRKSSVSAAKGEFLFRLTQDCHPTSILELGTCLGISTMYFSLAAPESTIITIEGCIDSAGLARENFEKAGLKNITVLVGTFDDRLDHAFEQMPSPGLVFIDGNHKKAATLKYFEKCLQHIHPETVLIFDDIHWSKEMEDAWTAIKRHPSVKLSIDIYHMGIVYFRKQLSKEDYSLRF